MSELKCCPFCGGEADTRVERNANVVSVGCSDCNIRTQYMVADDIGIAEAIVAWNTRAEMSYEDALILLDELGLSERTCHVELNESKTAVICSNCGSTDLLKEWCTLKGWDGETHIDTFTTYPYCPNCGAKAVDS